MSPAQWREEAKGYCFGLTVESPSNWGVTPISPQEVPGIAFGLALSDINAQQCTYILFKSFKSKHSLTRCTGEEGKRTSRSQMFAPLLQELPKELCRDRSYTRCCGISLPSTVAGTHAYQAFLSPWTELLCLASQKAKLPCGKSWGVVSRNRLKYLYGASRIMGSDCCFQ